MTESFAVDLPSGAQCIGERDAEPAFLGPCILLHDVGSDLDQMRSMAQAMRTAGFAPVLVDLPGHGLSSGTLETDGSQVLGAVLDALRDEQQPGGPVVVVAEGLAADLVLVSPAADRLTAMVLLSPRVDAALEAYPTAPSRFVTSLVLLDPQDAPSVQASELLRRSARSTWGRVFAHRSAESDSGALLWPLRARESAARFLSEKATFARYKRGSQARQPEG
ncbi:MAG: hypothetical protein KGP12_06380 [Actinomycetales bacterium]|nr:hypothetical protein [Actinomycetales bacterium]